MTVEQLTANQITRIDHGNRQSGLDQLVPDAITLVQRRHVHTALLAEAGFDVVAIRQIIGPMFVVEACRC